MQKIFASYRIGSIPRFATDEVDARQYDSWIGQRALWDALIFQVIHKHRLSVELRISSFPEATGVNVDLRILGKEVSQAFFSDLEQLEALLPKDYKWTKLPEDTLQGGSWWMAGIVRKLEYVDLPIVSPDIHATINSVSLQDTSKTPSQKSSSAKKEASLSEIFPTKEIPLPNGIFDFQTKRYVMPLPGQIDDARPRQKSLYGEIFGVDRGIVSLCIHPIDKEFLEKTSVLALNWKHILDHFIQAIANSGFADMQHLRSAYDRYSLPASYLTNVTLQVATPSREQSISLANIIASYFGGAKAFRIVLPKEPFPIECLARNDLFIPNTTWFEKWFFEEREETKKQLAEADVAEPLDGGAVLDILSYMPHVFTKDEATNILRLPFADEEGLPGLDSRMVPPFTIPSLRFLPASYPTGGIAPAPKEEIRLGMVDQGRVSFSTDSSQTEANRYAGKAWHTIGITDLTKHALIVGSTGSGKTMTTLFMVRELARNKVPFMVIEPVKTEYYDRLKNKLSGLYRLRLEGSNKATQNTFFLPFDPLRIQKDVTVARHASYLKSCFEAAFPMDPVMSLILENGLLAYYTGKKEDGCCGLNKFSRGGPSICRVEGEKVFPSFATFKNYFIEKYLPQEFRGTGSQSSAQRAQDYKEIFERRFKNLGDGILGECFKAADRYTVKDKTNHYDAFGRFLKYNTVVELDAVPDADQKALLMAFILTYMFERRQAEDFEHRENPNRPTSTDLQHVMIIEEAHRVLSSSSRGGARGELSGQDSKAKAVSLFVDMLAEIRAYGQGLVIVEQIPTKIVPEAVKNTNLKIMLRLTSKDDRDYLGEAMNFTEAQKRFVTNLKVEKGKQINFVVFEEGIDQPLMLALPLQENKKETQTNNNWLYDEFFVESKKA